MAQLFDIFYRVGTINLLASIFSGYIAYHLYKKEQDYHFSLIMGFFNACLFVMPFVPDSEAKRIVSLAVFGSVLAVLSFYLVRLFFKGIALKKSEIIFQDLYTKNKDGSYKRYEFDIAITLNEFNSIVNSKTDTEFLDSYYKLENSFLKFEAGNARDCLFFTEIHNIDRDAIGFSNYDTTADVYIGLSTKEALRILLKTKRKMPMCRKYSLLFT